MSPDDVHLLAGLYALNALKDDERASFEGHLSECDTCPGDLHGFTETAARLAAAVATPTPPNLRSEVLHQVSVTRQVSPLQPTVTSTSKSQNQHHRSQRKTQTRNRPSGALLLAAAALLLVLGFGIASALSDNRPTTAGEEIVAEIVAAPDAEVVELTDGSGTLRLVHSAERGELAIIGSDLDDPGPGFTYQLWAIGDSTESVGLFAPSDGAVRSVVSVETISTQWGVTLEPEGGSDQPTSELLYRS